MHGNPIIQSVFVLCNFLLTSGISSCSILARVPASVLLRYFWTYYYNAVNVRRITLAGF
jgi:hypothetical protein